MEMKTVNTFVNKENYISFTCPYCQRTRRISVEEHKGINNKLVTKCTCQNRFMIDLNYRQFYRKEVNLVGEVKNVSTGSRNYYSMVVVNLSMSGLLFKVIGPKDIKNGHRLHVRFTLDDKQANEIDKEARVIDIRGDYYGCEFLNLAYEEKELGYYLFPS